MNNAPRLLAYRELYEVRGLTSMIESESRDNQKRQEHLAQTFEELSRRVEFY